MADKQVLEMAKTYQGQLIVLPHESIVWWCGHDHKSMKEARECTRKNAPEIAERVVTTEHKGK